MRRLVWAIACLIALTAASSAFWQSRDSNYNVVISGGGSGADTFDPAATTSNVTLSNGNLTATGTSAVSDVARGSRSIVNHSSGKFYAEFTLITADASVEGIAVVNSSWVVGTNDPTQAGAAAVFGNGGFFFVNGVNVGSDGALAMSTGDVVSAAVDLTNNKVWWRKNGGFWDGNGSDNPATNTGGFDISSITGGAMYLFANMRQQGVWTANFAGSFSFTAPSGFSNW